MPAADSSAGAMEAARSGILSGALLALLVCLAAGSGEACRQQREHTASGPRTPGPLREHEANSAGPWARVGPAALGPASPAAPAVPATPAAPAALGPAAPAATTATTKATAKPHPPIDLLSGKPLPTARVARSASYPNPNDDEFRDPNDLPNPSFYPDAGNDMFPGEWWRSKRDTGSEGSEGSQGCPGGVCESGSPGFGGKVYRMTYVAYPELSLLRFLGGGGVPPASGSVPPSPPPGSAPAHPRTRRQAMGGGLSNSMAQATSSSMGSGMGMGMPFMPFMPFFGR